MYCIVFEKKIDKKICQKYIQRKNLSKKLNCIVLFSKKKIVKKIALYCIVFEKRSLKIFVKTIVLYCFRKKNRRKNLPKKFYCIVLFSKKEICQKICIVLYCTIFERKIVKEICQKNCIVLSSNEKLVKKIQQNKFVKKI